VNATSPSPAESSSHATQADAALATRPVRVWDAPVRLFHALMLLCFAGAWLTAETERWRLVHTTLGYTMVALVVFRLLWGFIGTRHARFASFVRGPGPVIHHLRAMVRREPEESVGHNPAGALAIVAMLGLTLAIGASGWALFNDVGGEWLEEVHEIAANALMAVVGIHVAGVLLVSFLSRTNLIGSMITGRKPGRAADAIRSNRVWVAVLMLVAVLGFWGWQWQAAPAPLNEGAAATASSAGPGSPRAGKNGDGERD